MNAAVAGGRRPAGGARKPFERILLDAVRAAVKSPLLGLCVGGSAARDDGGRPEDLDLIAIAALPHRARIRVVVLGCALDIFQETPRSIAAELRRPTRAAIVRLLSEARIVLDDDGYVAKAVSAAGELLAAPPPRTVYRSDFELRESACDLARRYAAAAGPVRSLVRGALLTALTDLAFVRAQCWPAPLHRAVETLSYADLPLAARLARAADGDDVALDSLVGTLVTPAQAVRHGVRIRVGAGRRRQRAQPAADRVATHTLPPPALARLSPAAVSAIALDELNTMSKLQLLTLQRVHGRVLDARQRRHIMSRLA